ncbi:MAG: exodeoxyribonuclease VII large subunit [Defluviitaleaceae bacterium]|nr:exodeoxyribonuclease VII large subunit [Defluviitaleaceae bacterium]
MMQIKSYKVSKIVEYMQSLLEDDMLLSSLWVDGEISGISRSQAGHIFFDLKDEYASMHCVMFKTSADDLTFSPKNGDFVRIYGRVSLYKKTGDVRFVGEFMEHVGKGVIKQDLDALKEKLLAEGVFENKRVLPKYPEKIAIITSPTGAVIADMTKVIRERNPAVKITLVPVAVQGENAPQEIAAGITLANAKSGADVIIVGRGGGSAGDLEAFNTEIVARAVFNSNIPIVSAVGHETDFSLCDFAADLRAATPTEAATIVTPDLTQMIIALKNAEDRLWTSAREHHARGSAEIEFAKEGLKQAIVYKIADAKRNLLAKHQILEKISPIAVLQRGFALVEDENGVVKQGASLTGGQKIHINFSDTKRDAVIL